MGKSQLLLSCKNGGMTSNTICIKLIRKKSVGEVLLQLEKYVYSVTMCIIKILKNTTV
jgi:hypothetical protein